MRLHKGRFYNPHHTPFVAPSLNKLWEPRSVHFYSHMLSPFLGAKGIPGKSLIGLG